MNNNKFNVLIVEDDELLGQGLIEGFQKKSINAKLAKSVNEAKSIFKLFLPHIILLDIGLPDENGLNYLKWIKNHYSNIPVMLLTAKDSTDDKIIGLESGADDYVVKPFSFDELLARIEVQRRHFKILSSSVINFKNITLSTSNRKVYQKNKEIKLTATEFDILSIFMMEPNKIHTKDYLESKIFNFNSSIQSNALEVHIFNLRKKISENIIRTVRGVGYISET